MAGWHNRMLPFLVLSLTTLLSGMLQKHCKVKRSEFVLKVLSIKFRKVSPKHNEMCHSETQSSKSVLPNSIIKKSPSELEAMCPSEYGINVYRDPF